MENPRDLSPLAKGEIQIGKELPFPVFDGSGKLLLAAGHIVATEKQLEEISSKGLYHNPRWQQLANSKTQMGTVKPTEARPVFNTAYQRNTSEEPSETGSVLKMSMDGQSDYFLVKLVGTIARDAFVITHPMRDGSCVFTKEGHTWEFRSFYGLSVYRFSAMVEKVLLTPHPLLVMSWPADTQLESKTIRTARRVSCDLPCTIRSPGLPGGGLLKGVIKNLSTGGIELILLGNGTLQQGQEFIINFLIVLNDRKFLLELQAKVMATSTESGNAGAYGVAFKSISDSDYLAIYSFVCDRLIHKIESPLYSKQ